MLLSDKTIREYLRTDRIRIDPMPVLEEALGSCSIDLRFSGQAVILRQDGDWQVNLNPSQILFVDPGAFYLVSTLERVTLPDTVAGRLEGRSSLARMGLAVHSTAGLFDPGWDGVVTLELSNVGPRPIEIPAHSRICAMAFEFVDKPVAVPYRNKPNNKYAGAIAPELSKFHEEER